jgi:hypothetical protein
MPPFVRLDAIIATIYQKHIERKGHTSSGKGFCINDETVHHPHCSHSNSPGSLPLEQGSSEDHVEGLAGVLPTQGYQEQEASLHSH